MNKKKWIYIGILIVVIAIVSIASFSYAFLSHIDEQHGKINIVAGTLDYRIESSALNNSGEITIGAGETKKFEIKVTSLNSIDSKYELYYLTTSNDVEVGYSSSTVDNPVGQVTANNNKKIIVRVTNPTNTNKTVTFKAVGGFTGNTLTKDEGKTINQLTSLDTSCSVAVGTVYNFSYTGSTQTFNVPCNGAYKVELWGASGGGNTQSISGKGSYTSGTIFLKNDNPLYIYVGEGGKYQTTSDQSVLPSTFNGGGGSSTNGGLLLGSGGGATDIRLTNGSWDNFDSLKSRIMVAAGGGSGVVGLGGYETYNPHISNGTSGGGLVGYDNLILVFNSNGNTYQQATGGTQTAGGTSGLSHRYGEFGASGSTNGSSSGGGSGYYGGNGGVDYGYAPSGGASGSSFISGHNGCVAISESSTSNNITPKISGCTDGTTNINCSVHYSNYAFANTVMVDGAGYKWTTVKGDYVGQPQPDGTTAAGHSGNGYARITYLGSVLDYDYTGDEQIFITPITGEYKLETWGAQGGSYNSTYHGGYGGYSVGTINLNDTQKMYVNVGGIGTSNTQIASTKFAPGGYNGGGDGSNIAATNINGNPDGSGASSAGGGATHVALKSGILSNLEQYKGTLKGNTYDSNTILEVAAGGGGSIYYYNSSTWTFYSSGGSGGGYIGGNADGKQLVAGTPGTQINAGCVKQSSSLDEQCGTFGAAVTSVYANYPGGGAGFYGGSAGAAGGGAGGSGYIGSSLLTNKKMVCYNCATSTDVDTFTESNECVHTTATADCSKKGNGYARITYIGD